MFGAQAVAAIMVSALLGLLVSLSTFLCIGATSSVTYNGASAHHHRSWPYLKHDLQLSSVTWLIRLLL